MCLLKTSVLVLLLLASFSNGYNITTNFEKITFPDQFVGAVETFITNNGNNISQQCRLDMEEYIKALFLKPQPWAWLMFDAGTKISSGILSGNLVDLGQFDQCMNIVNKTSGKSVISGKYCLGSIPLALPETSKNRNINAFQVFQTPETRMVNPSGAISSMFATCLPDSCSTTDIQNLYSWMGIKVEFFDSLCQSVSTQPTLRGGDIAVISFLSVVVGIMLISTVYDVFVLYLNKKPLHSVLIAFSVFSNGKKLISTSKSSAQISCLSGIRVISMMWVILGHRYTTEAALPIKNYFDAIRWMFDVKNMFIMGSTVSVDTFFVLGGLLVSYNFMIAMAKGHKFNIIVFYIHRYLRLTPILAVVVLIYATILRHLGSGPLWNNSILVSFVAPCEKHWWSTLLYVQNYVNPSNVCIGQSWYLSVDTQLFLLSPIILLPLIKWPLVGVIATVILTCGSILASFLVAWFDQLYGFIMGNQGLKIIDYVNHYYFPTHTRAGPWLMGLLLGYYIFQVKQNRKRVPMNKILASLLWLIALTILCACVYTGHNTLELNYEYNRLANSFYAALLRPGWALGICWVIFASVIGYGGPINWFLSLPMFQVVAKFTYSMYLTHIGMQTIVSYQTRTSLPFSNLTTLYTFWGDFAFTLAVAIFFTLAFESPIIIIEKVIFGSGKEKPSQTAPSLENGKKTQIL